MPYLKVKMDKTQVSERQLGSETDANSTHSSLSNILMCQIQAFKLSGFFLSYLVFAEYAEH